MKKNLVILLSIFSFISCRHKSSLSISEIISKNHLRFNSRNDMNGVRFFHYDNSEGARLEIGTNLRGDTVLKYFTEEECCGPFFYKVNDTYIAEFNWAFKDPNYVGFTGRQYPGDMYFQDSLHYFIADTISYTFREIKRPHDDSLIAMAIRKFGLTGNFKMVHPPFSKWFTILKDTLDSSQVYYEISNRFVVAGSGDKLAVIPRFEGIGQPVVYHLGIRSSESSLACSEKSGNSFCIYVEWLNKFSQKSFFYNSRNETEEVRLLLQDSSHRVNKKVILSVPKSAFDLLKSPEEQSEKAETLSECRIDLMKFYGDYFITAFLKYDNEYTDDFPPVFLLDTVHQKLSRIQTMDHLPKTKDVVPEKLSHPVILSDNYRHRVSDFIADFRLVKIKNDYRLIRRFK